jgi:hypothetical protein
MFWEEKILEVNVGRDDKKGPVFIQQSFWMHVQCTLEPMPSLCSFTENHITAASGN